MQWKNFFLTALVVMLLCFPEQVLSLRETMVSVVRSVLVAVGLFLQPYYIIMSGWIALAVGVVYHAIVTTLGPVVSSILVLVSTLRQVYISILLLVCGKFTSMFSTCKDIVCLLSKCVRGYMQVTGVTLRYRSYQWTETLYQTTGIYCSIGNMSDCLDSMRDKQGDLIQMALETKNTYATPQALYTIWDRTKVRLCGMFLGLALTRAFVYPVMSVLTLSIYYETKRFLRILGGKILLLFLLPVLPYTWMRNLNSWSTFRKMEIRGELVVPAEENEPTINEQLRILTAKLDALLKDGVNESKIPGSDFVASGNKTLIRIMDNNGKHVAMAFRCKINGRECIVTAKHAGAWLQNAEAALYTTGSGVGVKMNKFSFYGSKKYLMTQTLDIVAYRLDHKDMSYLKGAKSLKFKATPGVGSTISLHGYWAGSMNMSFGTVEGILPGFQFKHSASTEAGFSGTPLMLDGAVIGIHLGTKAGRNIALQTDMFLEVARQEDSEDLWRKNKLREYEDDFVLYGNQDEEANYIDQLDFDEEPRQSYKLREQGSMWALDGTWDNDDDDDSWLKAPLEFSSGDRYDFESVGFHRAERSGHQGSPKASIGGLMKIKYRMMRKSNRQAPTCGLPAFSNARREALSQGIKDQLKKSGRRIPLSLIGRGQADLLRTSDDHLESTLNDLAELLGLQTASNRTYWFPYLSTRDCTQQRHLMKMWLGIMERSGLLPKGETL